MDKKMTSGEIAKKAGVSQKAVRLYDEKGLLKPTDYSEGNYRLYDKAALQVLEKIVALKQIGFSLEEIRDNLIAGEAVDIEEALRLQLKVMEEKRYQIDKVIDSINRTLERKDTKLDWDDVADMVQSISLDIRSDEGHWDALQHTGLEVDWYVKVFNSLEIKDNEKVLDLGCGFSKLWRNNWNKIPRGTIVYGFDIHGSWADDFAKYISDNKDTLPEGVDILLEFENLEEEATWDIIKKEEEYSLIVAHYLDYELKDPETLVMRVSQVLSKDGMFSYNGPSVSSWNIFYKNVLEELGIKASFIDDKIANETAEEADCEEMLKKYFGKIESIMLPCNWHYTDADELIQKMKKIFPDQEKFINCKKDKIKEYFERIIDKDGEIIVETESKFWHCFK